MNMTSTCNSAGAPIPPSGTWLAGGGPTTASEVYPVALPPSSAPPAAPTLHRLREAREAQGFTRRRLASLLRTSIRKVEEQEQPSSDILLSDLYRWQKALNVPVAELLHEPDGELSRPVRLRSLLVRAMKTARSLEEAARQPSVRRLAVSLIEQLIEVMPELKETIAWPAVGNRRSQNDLGQAYFRRLLVDPQESMEGPDD